MKILILTKHFWPENFRINDIAKNFSKKNKIYVLSEKPSYHKLKSNFKNLKNLKSTKFWTYPRSKNKISIFLNYLSFVIFGCFNIFRFRKKKFDLVFIYATSPIFQALPGLLYCKIYKTPSFLWVQDLWPDVLEDLRILNYKFILSLTRKLTNFIYHKSDFIFAQSISFQKDIQKIKKKNVYLLYNPENKYFSRLNKKKKKLTLIFAGNLGKAQNIQVIIKAALSFKNENIIIKIYGSGSEEENIKKLIVKYKIGKIIKTLKPIKPNILNKEINNSDGLIITLNKGKALSKTLPAKLQTYMSHGKPIIASADGELFNYIRDNKLGFATRSNDVKGLVNSIHKLKKLNDKERNKIYLRAKKIFNKFFEIEKWTKNLELKLYKLVRVYNKKELKR